MSLRIRNAELLTAVFGRWPSFHDAEIIRLTLDRASADDATFGPTLEMDVHAFEMTNDVAPDGTLVLRNHVVVTFRFLEVTDLQLQDFNAQNAIWGLEITNIRERQLEGLRYEVHVASSFGLEGRFLCKDAIVVAVKPLASAREAR